MSNTNIPDSTAPESTQTPLMPSAETLEAVYTHMANRACEIVRTTGELEPQIFFLSVDVDAKEPAAMVVIDPGSVRECFSTPEAAAAMDTLLKRAFEPGEILLEQIAQQLEEPVNLIVQINEVMVSMKRLNGADPQEALSRLRSDMAAAEAGLKALSSAETENGESFVTDAILVRLRTPDGNTAIGLCPIMKTQDGVFSVNPMPLDHSGGLQPLSAGMGAKYLH